MTIETAIGMSADELMAMSDAQVNEYFKQYLTVTRPELQTRVVKAEQQLLQANPAYEKARQIAASAGIQMPSLSAMKYKKR